MVEPWVPRKPKWGEIHSFFTPSHLGSSNYLGHFEPIDAYFGCSIDIRGRFDAAEERWGRGPGDFSSCSICRTSTCEGLHIRFSAFYNVLLVGRLNEVSGIPIASSVCRLRHTMTSLVEIWNLQYNGICIGQVGRERRPRIQAGHFGLASTLLLPWSPVHCNIHWQVESGYSCQHVE